MQPRLPRSGRCQRCLASISRPSSTARGPVAQEPSQGWLGTQPSSFRHPPRQPGAPPAPGSAGVAQGGGAAGSGKAGSGNEKAGALKQVPSFCRQPKQQQPSPAAPGKASVVVVGKGEKRHEPEGSIAGRRSRLHPHASTTSSINATQNSRAISSRTVIGGASVFIDPS